MSCCCDWQPSSAATRCGARCAAGLPLLLYRNAENGDFYDGDFTKLVAVAFGPKALLVGESKPLETKIWFSDESKQWIVDAWYSFGIAPDRVEHAARLDIAP